MKAASVASLDLARLRVDGGTQPRAAVSEEHVEALRERLDELPPVVVFHDGKDYWLADGFHRVKAHFRAGRAQVLAEVRQGTRRDAVLYSCGANAAHGLPRSRDDKRRAVQTLLANPDFGVTSTKAIAAVCRLAEKTVRELRAELEVASSDGPRMRTVERGGATYAMDVSRLSARDVAALPPEEQFAVYQQADLELEAEEPAAPRKAAAPDDGLRAVTLRRPALVAQLYAGLPPGGREAVGEAFDRAVKKAGRRAG